jgi:hypothetical protein
MNETDDTEATDEIAGNGKKGSKRQRSAVSFPYSDLSDAQELAEAAWAIGGASPAPLDALAARLGHRTVASGGFRGKLGAARLFGLTRTSGMEAVLTELGKHIVDPDKAAQARADAFLRVPLFSMIYEKYRGDRIPGDEALESELAALGVAPKQKARARQVFQRSAQQAGYFSEGPDKLIRPVFAGRVAEPPVTPDADNESPRDEELPASVSDQPMIRGLFEQLPPAGVWPEAERTRWFDAAKAIFALVYKNEVKALPSESEQPSERSENGGRQEAKPL